MGRIQLLPTLAVTSSSGTGESSQALDWELDERIHNKLEYLPANLLVVLLERNAL